VAHNHDPDAVLVSEIMAAPVHSVRDDTPVEEALLKMAEVGTRRLVVTGEGDRVAGILTLDDVLDLLAREAAAIKLLLAKQQPKVPV
jgi:CBS domain-containing protein